MAYQHERTAARKCAAQILYTGEIRNTSALDLLNAGEFTCYEGEISDYAYSLIEGVEAHLDEIDGYIDESSLNWAIDRMPLMDLTILRIALYEMLHVDEVPISVSINEAVELAKVFGGEDGSPAFVNGMLGNIARQMDGVDASELNDVDMPDEIDSASVAGDEDSDSLEDEVHSDE